MEFDKESQQLILRVAADKNEGATYLEETDGNSLNGHTIIKRMLL